MNWVLFYGSTVGKGISRIIRGTFNSKYKTKNNYKFVYATNPSTHVCLLKMKKWNIPALLLLL